MESNEINSTTLMGAEGAAIEGTDVLFNDPEYDRKFRSLQTFLPFVDNLLLQSSGKIASDRLQSLQSMLKDTNTKMKYDVMAKCESVLQSLMKKMEAAHYAQSFDSNLREQRTPTEIQKSSLATLNSQSLQQAAIKETLNANEQNHHASENLQKNSVLRTNGHDDQPQTKDPQITQEKPGQTHSNIEQPCDEMDSQLATNPGSRSMVLTLKLAAARTARNAETTQKVSKRVPITWDDTSSVANKKSEIDTLKLAAARAARFATPPLTLGPRKVSPETETLQEQEKAMDKKCLDINTLKLAAARTSKPADNPDLKLPGSEQDAPNFLQSREKLKKFLPPSQKETSSDSKSPTNFQGNTFDLDSPRNDWDFQAAPELPGHWNPSPPIQNATDLSAGEACDRESQGSKLSQSRGSEENHLPAVSTLGSPTMASYYSPIHKLVQRRISNVQDSPLSPDESGPNTPEAKRRLRDKLSQEINMVHRVGTSKGGSLRGLAAKDVKAPPPGTKESGLGQDKKDPVKKPEKIVEIDMFSKELHTTSAEHQKDSPKVLKGLYAPRYKSSQENASAKSGILCSEHKPASRASVDASRLIKSGSDVSTSKPALKLINKDIAHQEKLQETNGKDLAGEHSRILSTMTTEELKRAVSLNVRNLPSPPTISPLVLESVKSVPCNVNSPSIPEKVVLNPAFNNVPKQIEPGFFSKSDTDLRLEDPNAFTNVSADLDSRKQNLPSTTNNRDPRTYQSRFDRDSPLSPDGNTVQQGLGDIKPGPRHITYHLNSPDEWQTMNSNNRWPPNAEGCLPSNPFTKSSMQEPVHNQYSQNFNREAHWMNDGQQQMQLAHGKNINHSTVGDFQGQQYQERDFHQPFSDQRSMHIPQDQERNRRLSGGEGRDFRGPQFPGRNKQQPMGNQFVPQITQELERGVNTFSVDESFEGSQFYIGSQTLLSTNKNPVRGPLGDCHGFRGKQFPGRNVHQPMGDQRGLHVPQEQGRNMNSMLVRDGREFQSANYQGRNNFGSTFDTREQKNPLIPGKNINMPFGRSHNFPASHNQRNSHPAPIEGPTSAQALFTIPPQTTYQESRAQGTIGDPRSNRDPVEKNTHDRFHWQNKPPLKPSSADHSTRPALLPNPTYQMLPKPVPIPVLSPNTALEKIQPGPGPSLPSTSPNQDKMPSNPDCIPFNPPRILDPRVVNRRTGQLTVQQLKDGSDIAPSKEVSSARQTQHCPESSVSKDRRQKSSRMDNTHRRYSKEHSRRGSWEAEESRRREEKRRSMEQSRSLKSHQEGENSSKKSGAQGELVSPLNSLYGSTIIQKTGIGYGVQKFKIPKIKKPDPPKPAEVIKADNTEVPKVVEKLTAEQQPIEQISSLPMEKMLAEKKPEQKDQTNIAQPTTEPATIEHPINEQPIIDQPRVEALPLAAPLIVEAFIQQTNLNVDRNQFLENLKLLGNLKPNQLKKFQDILLNSSSSDDSDNDNTAKKTKKKVSKLKTTNKSDGGLQKSDEDSTQIKEIAENCTPVSDIAAKVVSGDDEIKSAVAKDEDVVTARKLRSGRPGPLSTKKNACSDKGKKSVQSNDLDLSSEPVSKPRVTRSKRRNSLEILQADIKEMYISEGVLSASGRRICTILKKDEPLTAAAAKELTRKNTERTTENEIDLSITSSNNKNTSNSKEISNENVEKNFGDESDVQTSAIKNMSASNSKKVKIGKKVVKGPLHAITKSGKSLKDQDISACSSDGDDTFGKDKIESQTGAKSANTSDSDGDEIEGYHGENTSAGIVDHALKNSKTGSMRVCPMNSDKIFDELAGSSLKQNEIPSESSVANDGSPIRSKTSRKVVGLFDSSESAIEDRTSSTPMSSASDMDDDEEKIIPMKMQRRKKTLRTQKKKPAKMKVSKAKSGKKISISRIGKGKRNNSPSTKSSATECDSSPITKKKVAKPPLIYDSDSCVESIYSLVGTSDDGISSAKLNNKTVTPTSDTSISSKNTSNNSSVNLAAYVKLQIMPEKSLTASPSISSDECSDSLPLTLLAAPTSRRVARRGGRGRAPRSRITQPVAIGEAGISSDFDCINSEQTRDMFAKEDNSVGNDHASLDASISDIIDRLSKDDLAEDNAITKEPVLATKSQKKKRRSNWSLGVIKKKRPKSGLESTKSPSPEEAPSEGNALLENDTESVTKSQESDKQPPETNPSHENNTAVESGSETIEQCGEELLALPKTPLALVNQSANSDISAVAEPAADEISDQLNSQEDTKINADASDQPRLAEETADEAVNCEKNEVKKDAIRNVDKGYFIAHNSKSQRYPCKLCSWNGTPIVSHYALTHPDSETYISRLSSETAVASITESKEKGYVSGESLDESVKHIKKKYSNLTCRMCFFKCTSFMQFYDHCCSHTGEFRYKCTQCSALLAGKTNLGSHYQYHHKELRSTKMDKYTELFPLPPLKTDGVFAYVCSSCNFIQMRRSNVENHVKVHHGPESDSVQIAYINMHIESNKKRIALRKSHKNSTEPNDETIQDTKNSRISSKDEEVTSTLSQSTDLAAFLPTEQKSVCHTKTSLSPAKPDIPEESDVKPLVQKFMSDDQNPIFEALLRRFENPEEDQSDPTLHHPLSDSQTTSASFLADEISLDSSLSSMPIMEDLPQSDPIIGNLGILGDIIKRLEHNVGPNLTKEFQEFASMDLEDFEDQQSPIFVGPFEVKRTGNLAVYGCNVDECLYSTVSPETFISHLNYNHLEKTWDGMCQSCENIVIFEEAATLTTAFVHLLKLHLSSIGVESEEAQRQVELLDQDPLMLPGDASTAPSFRLRMRRFSGDKLSSPSEKEDGAENMCVIENVVSLAEATPLPPANVVPLLTSPNEFSSLAENLNVQSEAKPVNVKLPLRSPPKIIRIIPKPGKILKPSLIPSPPKSSVAKKISFIEQSQCPSTLALPDILTSGGSTSTHVVKALVQCVQAKSAKEPACYEKMLDKSKLRHLYKCMSGQCSFTTNNSLEFGRHVDEHKADKCLNLCAYCMKPFTEDECAELALHVRQEHGHCIYQCAYCFYRAFAPSYVVVHQNLTHTNKSISILQCADGGSGAPRPAVPLSHVVPDYVCGQSSCGETFVLTERFLSHLHAAHANIHNYACHLCSTVCFDARNFIAHYRVHALHHYQCRHCLHGAGNEEAMHRHLCNAHPGEPPTAVARQAPAANVEGLTVVDLGAANPVADELIVGLPPDEADVTEPEDSDEDAMVIDTREDAAAGEAAPVVELDSEDEAAKVVDLTSSAEDGEADVLAAPGRGLRSSPRKTTEVARGKRKDEGTAAAAKPRAPSTTSFEFGAITLEDLNETGLSGEKLYRCGFSKCDASCETVEELREHLMVCDHSRNSHGLACPHCLKAMKNTTSFCEHMRTHSTCRYGCGLCVFRSTTSKLVQLHLRARHRTTVTKCIPLNPLKFDPENDLFVVGPLRPDKRKNHLVSQLQSPDKKSRPKYVYQPDEGHLLPIGAIYPFMVTCATCSFTTKVRKNMERHLTFHKMGRPAPSQNQVNAVPCLEAKEMMFDKMTNLAASSNLKAPDASSLYLTPEDVARLPKFVPEQQRYRCGAANCTYNSCDENMLIHHLRALHRDEDYYDCPHCPPASKRDADDTHHAILIDKLSLHLKMHDNRLYKCGYCFYYDHRRHVVERHVADKHGDYRMHLNVVREPFGEGTPVLSAKLLAEREPAKEAAGGARCAWRCAQCEFESVGRPEMVAHSDAEHGKKLQYECGICRSCFQSKQSFDQHCGFSHPGLKEKLEFNFYKTENAGGGGAAAADAPFDTRPLWSRDASGVKHIRGILYDDEETDVAVAAAAPAEEPAPESAEPVKEEADVKEAMFLCSICRIFQTKVKADMKVHLYKELKYFRYQCSFCDKKVFSLTAGKKHMSRAHSTLETDSALILFEKDLETEAKVEEILGAQEDLMQLDNPTRPARAVRTFRAKPSPARPKEADVSDVSCDVNVPDLSVAAVEESKEPELSEDAEPGDGRSRKRHQPSSWFDCKDCTMHYNSVRGLKTHIRLSHLAQAKWICNTCQMTHPSRVVLENHSRLKHADAIADPPVSQNPVWTPTALPLSDDFWLANYGISPAGVKQKCGRKKRKTAPPSPPPSPPPAAAATDPKDHLKCPHCSHRAASLLLLRRHEQRHWVQKPFSCGRCTYNAMYKINVRKHSEFVHPNEPALVVAVEMPAAPDIKPIWKRRRRKQSLAPEICLHDGASPPKKVCINPSEVIVLESDEDVDEEIEVESLESQHFKCCYCPLEGATREAIREHWTKAHKASNDDDADADGSVRKGVPFRCEAVDGPLGDDALHEGFLCSECPEKFSAEALLNAHVGAKHPVFREIPCPKCDFKTDNVDKIRVHLKQHNFGIKCTLCGEAFSFRKLAEFHWELKHPDSPYRVNSLETNLDQYPSLRMLISSESGVGKAKNVAKKSTTKMPRKGEFYYARKSTGNAPWKRGINVSPAKKPFDPIDFKKLSVKVQIGPSEVDMRVDTYTQFFNISPKVLLVDCKQDVELQKHFPQE